MAVATVPEMGADMSDSRAIAGTYADLKFIKTRSVAQIVMEIPIEQADAFLKMFGAPQPGKEIPVAIARMNTAPSSNGKTSDFESEDRGSTPRGAAKPKGKFSDLSLPAQAGIRCEDAKFIEFLGTRNADKNNGTGELINLLEFCGSPEQCVRSFCAVTSRAELSTNHDAANRWRELERVYQAWLTDRRYPAEARR